MNSEEEPTSGQENPIVTINRDIRYVGPSSSGRMHEYQVSPEYRAELVQNGVQFSEYRENSFYAPTHVYLAPNVNSVFTCNVRGFVNDSGNTINFFDGLDKTKQKEFVEDQVDKARIKKMMKAQSAGLDELALYKVRLLEAQIRKTEAEITALSTMSV